MAETDLKKLKAKCNKLIDMAASLEERKKQNEVVIKELQEKKKALEHSRKSSTAEEVWAPAQMLPVPVIKQPEEPAESPGEYVQEPDIIVPGEVSENMAMVTPAEIFQMINILSEQLESQPHEEIVIRKLTFSAKLAEIFAELAEKIVRVFILGILMLLLSVGATMLFNAETREFLFEFLKGCMGGGI